MGGTFDSFADLVRELRNSRICDAEDVLVGARFVTAVTFSERGFKHLEPIETTRHETVRVYESSAAMEPHIWLRITVELAPDGYSYVDPGVGHAHLTLDQAKQLQDQLAYLIEHHYQVEEL